jgi:hypothetical protein
MDETSFPYFCSLFVHKKFMDNPAYMAGIHGSVNIQFIIVLYNTPHIQRYISLVDSNEMAN